MNQLLRRTLKYNHLKLISRTISVVDPPKYDRKSNNSKIFYGVVGVGALTCLGLYKFSEEKRKVYAASKASITGSFRRDLPNYTLEQVSLHGSKDKGIWVIYKQGVYDITEFVSIHPGGEIIMLAAGSSIEPFWLMYGVHHDDVILDILEEMRIGNISHEESTIAASNKDDPYANDPRRHRILIPASTKPFNAEPVPSILVDSYITPNDFLFVRNHLPVPLVDPKTYELEIKIEKEKLKGKEKVTLLTLDQLKKLPKHTITTTMMCAGNRRNEMTKIKQVKGLNWGFAAIGNAVWSGPRLRDVLISMGVTDEQIHFKHVQFEGLDTDPTKSPYGASIPFHKAMDKHGDVILAYEMNGEPLPRDHGYPVRVIVPGTVGARNVKWLAKIVVSKNESDAFWQQNDYKGFSPSVDWDTVDFKKSPAIQQLPVISAICVPQAGDTVKMEDGCIIVKGYAWSGGGQKIIRVDLTIDGGKTWHVADFDKQDSSEAPKHWTWTLWTAKIPVAAGQEKVEIWAKAVDSSYNTQPESFENIWNLRGVLGNAYHRVPISVQSNK